MTTATTPRLSEAARHLVIPEGITTSVWPRVRKRLCDVGIEFDLWQQGLSTVALGCRADGKYAATIGGVVASIPRQVGKTFTVGNLLIGLALEFPGLRVIWTSHHTRTTTNTFRSMQGMVRKRKVAPHLAHNGIRTANGEQEIRFKNGSIVMFGAREQGFGRGMDAIDIEVFDEAQILSIKALEDMVPATNQARHEHGALVFFIGTPPRPNDDGEAFAAKRSKAIKGETTDQVYVEFSADPDADADDRSQWPVMNPSYPTRTPLVAMLRMRENIPDEGSWRREAMGIWDADSTGQAVISADLWARFADAGPEVGTRPDALAVDMSHERQISVSACWRQGESMHIEEVWAGEDPNAAVAWICSRTRRRTPVVIDGASPAASLIPVLRGRRVTVNQSTAGDMSKACGLFEDMVTTGLLTHANQEAVNDALDGGRKRPIRDAGGWGWDRRDESVNIAPIVSVTLALFGASMVKKSSGNGRSSRGREAVML